MTVISPNLDGRFLNKKSGQMHLSAVIEKVSFDYAWLLSIV